MDFPLFHGASYQTLGIDAADSDGTDVISSASTNVKGAWVSLGTIPEGVIGFDVIAHKTDGATYLIDIGIGTAPNQVVIVPNLYIYQRLTCSSPAYRIPISLPAGQTLWARCQSASSSKTVSLSVLCKLADDTGPAPLGVATDYGAETANTSGITVDPGGTIHTKGSWVQIAASTSRDVRQLLLMFGNSEEVTPNPVRVSANWLFDIGIGAAAAEKIIIPDLGVLVNSLDDSIHTSVFGPFDVSIPAGSRLAARCQCSTNVTTAGERYLDLIILGFD